MKKIKVIIAESEKLKYLGDLNLVDLSKKYLSKLAVIEFHANLVLPRDNNKLVEADYIIAGYPLELNASNLKEFIKCKGIISVGVGYDNIDMEYATNHNILVCNIPDYCVSEMAEHTMALLLALVRKLKKLDESVRSHEWNWRHIGSTIGLKNSVIGLVGFGRVGKAVARRAKAFGMKILIYDPTATEEEIKTFRGKKVADLETLIKHAKIISLHLPLTKESYHIINDRMLDLMSQDTILINTSRGGLIDLQALINHLKDDSIKYVGLDVIEGAPHISNTLLQFENIILTPHVAFYSDEAMIRLGKKCLVTAKNLILGKYDSHILNLNKKNYGKNSSRN